MGNSIDWTLRKPPPSHSDDCGFKYFHFIKLFSCVCLRYPVYKVPERETPSSPRIMARLSVHQTDLPSQGLPQRKQQTGAGL